MKVVFAALFILFLTASMQRKSASRTQWLPAGKNAFNPLAGYDSIVYAARFGVSPRNSDNTPALNAAFAYMASLPDGLSKALVMPKDAVLTFSNKVNVPHLSNFLWEGNKATLISRVPVTDYSIKASKNLKAGLFIRTAATTCFSAQPVLDRIPKGATTFQLSRATAALLQVGDMVVITSQKQDGLSPGIRQGGIKLVKKVDVATGVVTVTTPFLHDSTLTTADNLLCRAYKTSVNVCIRNLNVELYAGSLGTGLELRYFSNLLLENVQVDGKAEMRGEWRSAPRTKDSYVGIAVTGYDIVADRIRCTNFWDNDMTFGYGIAASGENIRVKNSQFRHCKHGVTFGDNNFYSQNILVDSCYGYDAMFEAHQQCFDVTFQYNTVEGIGEGAIGHAFFSRAYRNTIRHNIIKGATTLHPAMRSNSGVYINGGAGSRDFKIDSNTITGFTYGIQSGSEKQKIDCKNFFIRGNSITRSQTGGEGMLLSRLHQGEISGNKIEVDGHGLNITGARDMAIKKNHLSFGNGGYGIGILLQANTSATWTNIIIADNNIKPGTKANAPIRLQDGYNVFFFVVCGYDDELLHQWYA